ncbi:MAG: hypothetical protein ACLP05_13040 [Candidatus Kryptoniota bacterium]
MKTKLQSLRLREILYISVSLSAAAFMFDGCYVPEQVVELDNLKVDGQIHQMPIRVNDGDMSGHLRISPYLEFMPKTNLTGVLQIQTNQDISQLSPYDSTRNLDWNMPSYVGGLSFDYGLSKILSFSAGGNYSQADGKHSFEWDMGLGLCFDGENGAGRIEAGLQWQDISYDASFDKYEVYQYYSGIDSVKFVDSFGINGSYSTANFYINLTLNTKYTTSPINGFVRIGYGVTSLLDDGMFPASQNVDISSSTGFITVTPGLYYDINKSNRIILGCQFMSPTSLDNSNPSWLFSPVVQLDFLF